MQEARRWSTQNQTGTTPERISDVAYCPRPPANGPRRVGSLSCPETGRPESTACPPEGEANTLGSMWLWGFTSALRLHFTPEVSFCPRITSTTGWVIGSRMRTTRWLPVSLSHRNLPLSTGASPKIRSLKAMSRSVPKTGILLPGLKSVCSGTERSCKGIW